MDGIAFWFRLFFLACGLPHIVGGLIYWKFKEGAADADPTSFWFWWSSGPYITNADERVNHVAFKAKLLLAIGTPSLLISIFAPDNILKEFGILGIGLFIFLTILIRYLLIADATDRNTEPISEAEEEKPREMEEKGQLRD